MAKKKDLKSFSLTGLKHAETVEQNRTASCSSRSSKPSTRLLPRWKTHLSTQTSILIAKNWTSFSLSEISLYSCATDGEDSTEEISHMYESLHGGVMETGIKLSFKGWHRIPRYGRKIRLGDHIGHYLASK